MDIFKAVILGIVQGLSEFLPISSSGHLVLVEKLLNFHVGGLAFEIFVHFGTLLAVVWVFRRDLAQMILAVPQMFGLMRRQAPLEKLQYARFNWYIIVGSVPAAVVGLLFEKRLEQMFDDPFVALLMLSVTGLIMWSSRYTRESKKDMGLVHAILIGCAQACAIIPGISRSGSTIVSGLWLGLPKKKVAEFSFLLSTPVILGGTVLKLKEIVETPIPQSEIIILISATVAAAISGYFAVVWMLNLIRRQKLEWFGVYCILVSILGLSYFYLLN